MIVLASKSPRRRELLTQIGVNFICKTSNIDETPKQGEKAVELVERLAISKARVVYDELVENTCVMGSDTIVTIDQHILGKPVNQQDCMRMLGLLSGKTHQVITAVAIIKDAIVKTAVVESDVTFTELSTEQMIQYWQTGEPKDKAGAYAIQGLAAQYISHLRGSYSAVMGLPLFETAQLLKQQGFDLSIDKSQ